MTETAVQAEPLTFDGTPNLNAALAAVQTELPSVHKAETADAGTYTYSYADLASVSAAVLPLLGRNGLAFTAWPSVNDQGKFVLRYELLHKSGEQKAGEYPISGGSAQAIGSAITYARRYALCAVTGVAPDDDDDAAAADAKRQAEHAAEQAKNQQDRDQATQSVMGAWANHFGQWDGPAAAQMFQTWSKGGDVTQAPPGQLRAFTGYLLALPKEDAGSTPNAEPTEPDGSAEQHRYNNPEAPLSDAQRVAIIAALKDLGISERQDRLQWMTSTLGRTVKSTSALTMAEAGQLIETLHGGVTVMEGGESDG